MNISFTKMQGCGNDYIYINCMDKELNFKSGLRPNINSYSALSVFLSNRHFGIGSDGIVLIFKSHISDAKMRMFNIDGSEGKMCGNAIRCVAKFLFDNKIVKKKDVTVETLSGVKKLSLKVFEDRAVSAKVDMGSADFTPKKIPVNLVGEKIINRKIKIGSSEYTLNCVSMGNPHCVLFYENINDLDILKIGKEIEESGLFLEGVNVEFVKLIDKNTIRMRVLERGSGETLGCGTGACAAAICSVENGFLEKNKSVRLLLKGGELKVDFLNDVIFLTGNCSYVFSGNIEL